MKRRIQLLSVILIFAGLLLAIRTVQHRLNALRESERLVDTAVVENAPPVIAFTTVVLGSFRGLLADLLWLRAASLQDQGQYFEMVQLASWITKLQPRFTAAAAYLAWNMAYNISVTCSQPEDRWRWVQRGIELLRDEALIYNPGDALLYKELGWIYQHKLGNILDDANLYYKNQLAISMMQVFGGPEPPLAELLAAAPDEAGLRKQLPEKAALWDAIRDAGFADFAELERQFRENGTLPEALRNKLSAMELRPLEMTLRSRWLRQVFRLDPDLMQRLNQRYGKLDWRLPEAHAIYWASCGIEHDRSGEIKVECERMITQSLKDACNTGRLVMAEPEGFSFVMLAPNFNVIDATRQSYLDAWRRHEAKTFLDGLENFVASAVLSLYTYGHYAEARRQMAAMRKEFPDNPRWRRNLDEFVLERWRQDVRDASPQQAAIMVDGLIYRSCVFLACGEYDTALAHERLAAEVYQAYWKTQGDVWTRTGLPPFATMKARRTQLCLKNFPPLLAANLRRHLAAINQDPNRPPETPPKTE